MNEAEKLLWRLIPVLNELYSICLKQPHSEDEWVTLQYAKHVIEELEKVREIAKEKHDHK